MCSRQSPLQTHRALCMRTCLVCRHGPDSPGGRGWSARQSWSRRLHPGSVRLNMLLMKQLHFRFLAADDATHVRQVRRRVNSSLGHRGSPQLGAIGGDGCGFRERCPSITCRLGACDLPDGRLPVAVVYPYCPGYESSSEGQKVLPARRIAGIGSTLKLIYPWRCRVDALAPKARRAGRLQRKPAAP